MKVECCFIGHRKVKDKEAVTARVKAVIEELITEKGAQVFSFGSKSEFNDLCYEIVTGFKAVYPKVERVVYTCKSEAFVSEEERETLEKISQMITKTENKLLGFESEREFRGKYSAGRASYIERNQAMIDDSDFCVFYYDENTQTKNSGTEKAYRYAVRRKKPIVNVFDC